MERSLLVVLLTLLPALALGGPSEPPPASVDISSFAGSLSIYHDGKGHYLVIHQPMTELRKVGDLLFYGNGKRFYRQRVVGRSRNGEDAYFAVTDPRVSRAAASYLVRKSGEVHFYCEKRDVLFRELDGKKTSAMLKAASFHEAFFRREPYALARDSTGVYYYVDRTPRHDLHGHRTNYRASDFRVYGGMRGKMKLLPMKNVVSDSSGEIFITANGQLRLVLDKNANKKHSAAQWLVGQSRTELTVVDPERSQMMIFRDLGPYLGQRLERPCDDL